MRDGSLASRPISARLDKTQTPEAIHLKLLDHVIVLKEGHLRRLRSYLLYYHGACTHLALEKDSPEPRAVEPPEQGRIFALSRSADSIIATSVARRSRSRQTQLANEEI